MKIDLIFEDITHDIEGALIQLYVEDQSEADAPAAQIFSISLEPITVRRLQPVVTVNLNVAVPIGNFEPALIVRVKAQTQANQPIEFLNTTTIFLPRNPTDEVQVVLSRIV